MTPSRVAGVPLGYFLKRKKRIGGVEGLYLSTLGWTVEVYCVLHCLYVFAHCAAWWWAGKLWRAITHDAMVFGTALSAIGTVGVGLYLLWVL
jgi:hypothetical protein